MSHFFTYAVLTATVAAAIALATPFLLASLGETVGQRSGVINLGVDGIMLLSAFATYFAALKTGNLLYGVLAGMGVGAVMGVITAFISVTLKAEQGISGIGVYLFGLGFSDLLFIKLVGTPLPISELKPINIPLLDRIPAVGGMLFKQTILVYLAFALVPVLTFVLNRTSFGLKIRAAGENPAAADSVGVNVPRIRWTAVLIGCTMAGLAGAALLLYDGIFMENLTQSEGFIAVALVYFGAWRPVGVMGGSVLYGLAIAVVLEWKSLGIIPLSASDLAATAPAVITILALLTVARRFRQPAVLGKPYERGG
ncbi:MAG: ABC transporter permease [Acidimicrobiales bacterium]|jgi:general nucleoside transport system permease protein